eukprot:8889607-Pyramimonas_sp.AAC.1
MHRAETTQLRHLQDGRNNNKKIRRRESRLGRARQKKQIKKSIPTRRRSLQQYVNHRSFLHKQQHGVTTKGEQAALRIGWRNDFDRFEKNEQDIFIND